MADDSKKRGRPPLTDEQKELRRIEANERQAKRHKRNGYASQKKYHENNDPEKEKKWRETSRERRRGKYYEPTLRMPKEFQAVLSELSKQTGLSINQIFIGAVEEKYDIVLHKSLDSTSDD